MVLEMFTRHAQRTHASGVAAVSDAVPSHATFQRGCFQENSAFALIHNGLTALLFDTVTRRTNVSKPVLSAAQARQGALVVCHMPVVLRLVMQRVGHPLGEVSPTECKNIRHCLRALLTGPTNESLGIDITVFHDDRSLVCTSPL